MPHEKEELVGPKDGDPFEEPELEEDEEQEPDPEEEEEDPRDAEIAALKSEMESLKRQIPPAQPATEDEEEDDSDLEELIFQDPKQALRIHGERIASRVKKELQREYQQDQGTQKFWNDFFEQYPDLKDDRDLVEATLSGNLSRLADMPVQDAIKELGRLTRQRISRYQNRNAKKRPKAQAEGAGQPAPKRQAPAQDRPKTLSDIIKQRRQGRRGAAA